MADLRRQSPPKIRSQVKPGWWPGTKRWIKYWSLRLMRQKSSPKNLAMACALGVFIGAMPIMPLQSVVVIALAVVMRVNKFAAWLATCYSNAATMVPFYYFLYLVGSAVTPIEVAFDADNLGQMFHAGLDFFLVMLAGGLTFGIPATLVTYFGSLFLIRRYRQRRAIRLLRKRTGS